MATLFYELRYALRQLGKSPGFTLVSILTLALGIGANVAVFSVTNAVLLNPSGIPHPDGLVALRARYSNISDLDNIDMSPTDFGDALAGKNIFSAAAVMQAARFNYSLGNANPELLQAVQVSSGFFDTFHVKPLLGRVFTPEEDQPGAEHEVVLSYRAWHKRFGGDPRIVGRVLTLNDQPFRVVGIMDSTFNWPNQVELWTPIAFPPGRYRDENYRYNESLFAIARLQPGVSLQRANVYLNAKVQEHIAAESASTQGSRSFARASGWGMFAVPLTQMTGGALRKPLSVLLIAVGIVLLIACANIAGLQIARASARQREFAVKVALGATKGRLICQALLESVLLTLGGVVLGLAIASALAPLLVHGLPSILGSQIHASLGGPVLIFLIAIAALCSLLCGVVPAWQRARSAWFAALQEGGRSDTGGAGHRRARSSLVVAQIALSLLLLAGAGLLLSSLRAVEQVETGFRPSGVLSASFSLPDAVYGPAPIANPSPDKDAGEKQKQAAQDASEFKTAAFYSAVLDRLPSIPGVSSAALAITVPFDNNGGSSSFNIKGQTVAPNQPGPHGYANLISQDYFATLGIPLVGGREFTAQDRKGSELVAIVDTTLAHQYWPGKNPIGEHIGFDTKGPWYTIVGIAAHARASSLESDTSKGTFYLDIAQAPQLAATIIVRGSRSPESLTPEVASAVRSADAGVAIYDVKTMEQRVDESLIGRRFVVLLLSTFAGLALLLAALGLYGVISYSVRLRTRELGVRMALGAQRGKVLQLVLLQGLRLAVTGMLCGVVAAVALGRVFSSLLFQVGVLSALPWISAIALLLGVVLLATLLPARRAASIEPMQALRME